MNDKAECAKIVYLTRSRLPTEKAHGYQIVKMCEAFADLGAEVTLFYPFRHQPDRSLDRRDPLEHYGVSRVFRVERLRNLDIFRVQSVFPGRIFSVIWFCHGMLWSLYAVLRVRRDMGDVCYTRDVEVAFWLAVCRMPAIFEAHTVPRRLQRLLLRVVAGNKALKAVAVLTNFVGRGLSWLGFAEDRIVRAPDGVDLRIYEALPSKERCRQVLNLPKDRPIVGYIGRFETMGMEKGIAALVQALAQLMPVNGKDPLLICVGGPMHHVPEYRDMAGRLGLDQEAVAFIDCRPVDEVPLWIRACDVVTIPWPWSNFSAYYTSPLKLFEYMAAGVPIVASDLPSLREVLRHGQNALLVEPGSPLSLAQGLRKILTERSFAGKLADKARLDVSKYTWQIRAKSILNCLKTVDFGEGARH